MTTPQFQKKILSWYEKNRRDLSWRDTKDPYHILVSEVMLQQTQVTRVIPKYREFLKAFPTLEKLARASDKKLLRVWSGLGYWRRALYLQQTAQQISQSFKGKFPQEPKILETLPGIGTYTARAVACFAFGNTDAFLDTNIRRVYLHFFFPKEKNVSDKEVLKIAQRAVWKKNPREWHYALFDYGATVLKNNKANHRSKHYAKQSRFAGSLRFFRAEVIRFLLSKQKNTAKKEILESFLEETLHREESRFSCEEILESLRKDGILKDRNNNLHTL